MTLVPLYDVGDKVAYFGHIAEVRKHETDATGWDDFITIFVFPCLEYPKGKIVETMASFVDDCRKDRGDTKK